MRTNLQFTCKLSQHFNMNYQLGQAISLLQYSTLELIQFAELQIEQNPLLEVDEKQQPICEPAHLNFCKPHHLESWPAEYEDNTASSETLIEHLLAQTLLCRFQAHEQQIAEMIIYSIDENGQLTSSLEELMRLNTTYQNLPKSCYEKVLHDIQQFSPTGVAYRNTTECLLLQLNASNAPQLTKENAITIITNINNKGLLYDRKKLANEFAMKEAEFTEAFNLIKSCTFHPGLYFKQTASLTIEPDLYVKCVEKKWQAILTEQLFSRIKINEVYQCAIKENRNSLSYQPLQQKLQEAQWFLKSIEKRNRTLLLVANYIMAHQQDFFNHGKSALKPLTISEVAEAIGMHESTISRITTEKYIATPSGLLELKFFFSSKLKTDSGDFYSATAVKSLIAELIQAESNKKPISDADLASILQEKGLNIARRTVAKYREALGILPSYMRSKRI